MATYLETYRTKKLAYEDLLSHGRSLDGKDLCFCLEAIYRVQVLETLSLLERTCQPAKMIRPLRCTRVWLPVF